MNPRQCDIGVSVGIGIGIGIDIAVVIIVTIFLFDCQKAAGGSFHYLCVYSLLLMGGALHIPPHLHSVPSSILSVKEPAGTTLTIKCQKGKRT